ncbi:hypothetical protein B0H10DRAFT_1950401 [Mycena sp. CBHHK59/15]|nr:hypothetical protein B0H10DRAFT_1950401 [Mycena sp. CBHHK59/15]
MSFMVAQMKRKVGRGRGDEMSMNDNEVKRVDKWKKRKVLSTSINAPARLTLTGALHQSWWLRVWGKDSGSMVFGGGAVADSLQSPLSRPLQPWWRAHMQRGLDVGRRRVFSGVRRPLELIHLVIVTVPAVQGNVPIQNGSQPSSRVHVGAVGGAVLELFKALIQL